MRCHRIMSIGEPAKRWAFTCVALLGTMVAGCNRSPSVPMSGTVTLDGAPIKQGTLRMIPTDSASGTSTGATIIDGRYDIDGAKGPVRGLTYRVEISAINRSNAKSKYDIVPDSIPEKYNRKSTLTVTIPADSDSVQQDFPLDVSSR